VQENAVAPKKFKNRNSLANVDPPLASEDSLNETFVEKQKTPRGEWITCLAENENYPAHKVEEKYLKKNT